MSTEFILNIVWILVVGVTLVLGTRIALRVRHFPIFRNFAVVILLTLLMIASLAGTLLLFTTYGGGFWAYVVGLIAAFLVSFTWDVFNGSSARTR